MNEPPTGTDAEATEPTAEPRLPDDSPPSESVPSSEALPYPVSEPPMLEIHAPHETVHTWKDFLIHIATIVIGLLIAIGLEQIVEFFHHRNLAAHARETLTQEINANRPLLTRDLYSLRMHQAYLFQDLPVIQRARTHSLAASDRIVVWHPYSTLADAAWQNIHDSETASLLPYTELHQFARVYRIQDSVNSLLIESAVGLNRAETVFYRSAADRFDNEKARHDHPYETGFGEKGEAAARAAFEEQAPGPDRIQQLTPAQLDRLEQAIQQGIYEDDRLINLGTGLQAQYASSGGGYGGLGS